MVFHHSRHVVHQHGLDGAPAQHAATAEERLEALAAQRQAGPEAKGLGLWSL